MNIPERLPNSINGLRSMIAWLKEKYNLKELNILEIGSWTGLSAIEFAKEFKNVICIDPWEATSGINTKYSMNEVENIFNDRIKDFNNIIKIKSKNETLIKQNKSGKIKLWSKIPDINKIHFIYIDGYHTYEAVKNDLINWNDIIEYAICGHDYWKGKFDGVIKAVNEVLGMPDKVFSDTSYVKVKKYEN